MVGWTPNITNKDVLRAIPKHRLLLETDAPYFVPTNKTRPSKPWYVVETAREISSILNMPIEKILQQCFINAI